MQTLDELIVESPVFEGLQAAELALVAGCASNVVFDAGDRLFREGDPADAFYLVRHGLVALDTYVPNRGQLTIDTVGAGEIVGWSWLLPPYRWHFTGRAVEQVRAVHFDGACLRGKCDDDRGLGYDLLMRFAQVLVTRLQATRLQLVDVYGDSPR
jgi:CRP/FNR family transcriptional regulator, cyclic AMP receptor protein